MRRLSYIVGAGPHARGANKKTNDWSDVAAALGQVFTAGGSVTLETTGEDPYITLQVMADGGAFLITLADEEGEVRTLHAIDAGEGQVEILGDLHDTASVTRDPDVVVQAFREMLERGDVSAALLR